MNKDKSRLVKFELKSIKLTKNEAQVLKLLIEAGEMIAPIYLQQENTKFLGANFYPHDASKQEIEEAAKVNPEISSSYTVVERVNGRLIAVPYHIKYATFLKPLADKLIEASKVTNNKSFAKLLKLQAKALLTGTYEEAIVAKLKMKPYKLDFSIGPDDRLDDQLFFSKASYEGWVGVVDLEQTKIFNKYKDLILSARRKALIPSEIINYNISNVNTKVEDVVLLSGLLAKTMFVGLNFPSDPSIIEKNGLEIVLFRQINELRLAEQILPTFKEIFSKEFRQSFTMEDLKRGNMEYIALHELAHSYLNYKNTNKSLQDFAPVIKELAATALGIRVCGSLLLKDVVTTKQLESMLIAFLCRSFFLAEKRKKDKSMLSYTLGGTIFINFMLESEALKQLKGMAIPNFTKIFISLHELSSILERLLSSGTRKDAEFFIKKYR
ncbi:hypothetical protein HYW43_03100 [Candidatus Daviesbacteria bacterium]|nr:hypothetical protein [Candidatus Daviesbacteria bacterium]